MDSHIKKLIAQLEKPPIHLGYRSDQYFSWMVEDCLASFGVRIQEPPPEAVRPIIFELSGLYAQAVINSEPFHDVLGSIYMALVSRHGQKHLGQYFTPWPVAFMMSRLVMGKTDFAAGKALVRVCDPACGSGVMMLAFASHVMKCNQDDLKRTAFIGIDLDRLCARMFPLQLLANSYIHQIEIGELLVFQGNALGHPDDLSVVIHVSHRTVQSEMAHASEQAKKRAVVDALKSYQPGEQLCFQFD